MTTVTIDQALSMAIGHQQNGRLAEAEAIYRQILTQQPSHPGALHLLGILASQAGNHQAAAELIRGAIAVNPKAPDLYFNLGCVCRILNRFDESVAAFQKAISLKSDFPEAYCNLGSVLRDCGQLPQAMACYRQALTVKGDYLPAYMLLGNALADIGRVDEAAACFVKVIQMKPDEAQAYGSLGRALTRLGRFPDALGAYQKAIELSPNTGDYYTDTGNPLIAVGRYDEAVAFCRRALELQGDHATAWCNMGLALIHLRRLDEAIAACRQAVALSPGHPGAHYNLGVALQEQGRNEEAIAIYRKAIELQPNYAPVHSKLSVALKEMGQMSDALAAGRKAVELDPNYAEGRWNLASSLLLSGDWAQGLAEYESRLAVFAQSAQNPRFTQPRWDGADLEGRTIVLHGEQGLGDTLQFVRYAPLVAKAGGKVVIQCQPAAVALVRRVSGVQQVVAYGETLPEFAVQCPLASLPLVMKTTPQTVPADVPYLTADASLVKDYRARLKSDGGRVRVGLVWAAGRPNHRNAHRSIALAMLGPLAAATDVTFYSLQKGPAAEEAKTPPPGMKLVDLSADLADLDQTAALIANLDLVISTDTAIAHLAGGMGKPVWTLLTFAPAWRWHLDRPDSPWYPTMHLFRQPKAGDWASVIHEAAGELKGFMPKPKAAVKPRKAR